MSGLAEVTDATFETAVAGGPTVVKLWAEW